MIDDIVEMLRGRYGEEWNKDDDANLRFSLEVRQVLNDLEGVHLIGDPEITNGELTVTVWVDFPIDDLMRADQVAYDVFGRISEEMFFTERRLERKGPLYPFVTGSDRHGHVGILVLAGPHTSDFAERQRLRLTGDVRYHA